MSFTPRVEGIGAVLAGAHLSVPDYQRSFSWTDTQVTDFWDDLSSAIDSDADDYFLGSVVFTKTESDRLAVVDGQQRLATASLLLAAIVDIFDARSDERAKELRDTFLGKKHVVSRIVTQNLMLNADDNHVFRQLCLSDVAERDITPSLESHRLLLGAFDYLKGKLEEATKDRGDDWHRPLTDWYQMLLTKASILQLVAVDEDRAFVIFETLNDRGVGLSTADLLRNHLFGNSGERLAETKALWTRAMNAVSADGNSEETETFLRHFWASKTGVARVKGLFKHMKPSVTGVDAAVNLAEELAESGQLWAATYDRDSAVWIDHPQETLEVICVLRMLSVDQCRPLLLASLRRLDPPMVLKVFTLVMNWSVRWIVAGGGGGGTVERLYAQTAQKVTDGDLNTIEGIAAEFTASVPDDGEFKRAFATHPIRRSALSRYFLSALERANQGTPEPELVPNQNVEEVNLEHVLPKNPGDEWTKLFPEDDATTQALLIGNQALLRKSHNRRIGNQEFKVKKPILAASDLSLTREIGETGEWGPDEIAERSERLAALAVGVWRTG